MLYNEFGIPVEMNRCFDRSTKEACRSSGVLVFRDLDKFVKEYSGFSNLVLENYLSIFLYFFLFCSAVFVIFCLKQFCEWARCPRKITGFMKSNRKKFKKIASAVCFRFKTKTRKVRRCRMTIIGQPAKIRPNQRRLKNRFALVSGIYRRNAVSRDSLY